MADSVRMTQHHASAAFLCLYEAYPPASGAASVTFNAAKFWPGKSYLLQLSDAAPRRVLPGGVEVVSLGGFGGSMPGKLWRMPGRLAAFKGVLRQLSPDLVVLEGASWAGWMYALLRATRRAVGGAPVVYHAHNVEYDLRAQKEPLGIAQTTWLAERGLLRGADASFAVSEVDAGRFEALYGVETLVLPNGVDADSFASTGEERVAAVREKYGLPDSSILFMGLPSYRPNAEAIGFLEEEVMPELHAAVPEARLVLIGGEIGHERPWLLNPGRIPHGELAPFLGACSAGVAPIFSGSGTRLKILEYMAVGLPVVSTAKGAEGLALEPGEHFLRAESGTEFAEALSRVLRGGQREERMAEQAKIRVQSRYSWRRIMERFRADLAPAGHLPAGEADRKE